MAAEQLDIFGWVDEGKAQPEKPVNRLKKLKLKAGEVAYQCMECDDEPTIYDRIKPMAKCPICNVLLEVVEEKIPEIKTEATKGWL